MSLSTSLRPSVLLLARTPRRRFLSTLSPPPSPSPSPPLASSSPSSPPTHPSPPLPPPPSIPFAVSDPPAPTRTIQQPVGAFRGGVIGFLLGLTTVGAYGYYALLGDYARASQQLIRSVDELKQSTEAVTTQLSRITTLEYQLADLASRTSTTPRDVESLRQEFRKVSQGQHLDVLNLKAHVWALEQDLQNLSKTRKEISVRI
ncbi:hypothetical protein JCM10212_003897 [Sporobolomyces blumeae]